MFNKPDPIMTESMGNPVPIQTHEEAYDNAGRPYFTCSMIDPGYGELPSIGVDIPETFTMPDGQVYDGEGSVNITIVELFEHYLTSFTECEEGRGTKLFTAWLRNYADRMDHAYAIYRAEKRIG